MFGFIVLSLFETVILFMGLHFLEEKLCITIDCHRVYCSIKCLRNNQLLLHLCLQILRPLQKNFFLAYFSWFSTLCFSLQVKFSPFDTTGVFFSANKYWNRNHLNFRVGFFWKGHIAINQEKFNPITTAFWPDS